MTHRAWAVMFGIALLLAPVSAAAQQSFDVNLGGFIPWSEDGRTKGDVLVVNRSYLLFDFNDFAGFYGEGAWSAELGKYFEASVGFGFYQRTVSTIYDDYTHRDGREIEQELKLRNMPLTAVVRAFPLGHRRIVQPYAGGGVGVNFWRYSETGEFIDFSDNAIFRAAYVDSGTAVGPVGLLGVRARMASAADIGMELRYQWAEADLSTDFLSDKIDLGGWSVLGTLKFRF